ncbi:hypothetical protein LCGC14_1460240 [marine sediment metagenome]|uniref:Methyltransferase domain-containing protein n=1 Tax=marine sediment metagenome TaxID=412755 RepID=A0A0F9MHB6_9ZZZZ
MDGKKMTEQNLIEHIKKSIDVGKNKSSKLTKEALSVSGMVCPKIRHFLNAICSMDGCRYLEVGSWQGASLVAALYDNFHARGVAIENFSRFNPEDKNELILRKNVSTLLSAIDMELIAEDCWSIDLARFKTPFNVYFYDGRHLRETQERAFIYFNSVLTNPFIAIIDDWNVKAVKEGTKDAFDTLGYEIVFDDILSPKTIKCKNSIYVAVIKKNG